MPEPWLRSNRRLLLMGMILPLALVVIGVVAAFSLPATIVRSIGFILLGLGAVLVALIALQLRIPRLAYRDGDLLVYLRSGAPLKVPVEFVECLFLSTGTGQIPGPAGANLPVQNLVVRLAEKATDFHHRDTKPTLGRWDDGYIVIHGAWCEPLNVEIARRLNERLAQVQQARPAVRQ